MINSNRYATLNQNHIPTGCAEYSDILINSENAQIINASEWIINIKVQLGPKELAESEWLHA